jgi:hypothetical protein
LLEGYAKAIDALTINEENRLRKQVKDLTVNRTEMQKMKMNGESIVNLVKNPKIHHLILTTSTKMNG